MTSHLTDEQWAEVELQADACGDGQIWVSASHVSLSQELLRLRAEVEELRAPRKGKSVVAVHPRMWDQTRERLAELESENAELREQIKTGQVQLMSLMDDDPVDLEWQKRRDKDAELGASLRAMVRRYGVRHLLSFAMPLMPSALDEAVAEAAKAGGDDA